MEYWVSNYEKRVMRLCEEARMDELEQMRKDALEVGGADGLVLMRRLVRRLAVMRFGVAIRERLGPLLAGIDDLNHLDDIGEWIDHGGHTKDEFLRRVEELLT